MIVLTVQHAILDDHTAGQRETWLLNYSSAQAPQLQTPNYINTGAEYKSIANQCVSISHGIVLLYF